MCGYTNLGHYATLLCSIKYYNMLFIIQTLQRNTK